MIDIILRNAKNYSKRYHINTDIPPPPPRPSKIHNNGRGGDVTYLDYKVILDLPNYVIYFALTSLFCWVSAFFAENTSLNARVITIESFIAWKWLTPHFVAIT